MFLYIFTYTERELFQVRLGFVKDKECIAGLEPPAVARIKDTSNFGFYYDPKNCLEDSMYICQYFGKLVLFN